MWKLFGKNEDEYLVDGDTPTDPSQSAPATGIAENEMASAPTPPPPAAPDLSAPVMPPADSSQPAAPMPTPTPMPDPVVLEPAPVVPAADPVSPAPASEVPMDGASGLTPNLETTTPTPEATEDSAVQPAGLDAAPNPATMPGVDTTQAVMDHQMDATGSSAPAADSSSLMSPGASNDGPPVPGVGTAAVEGMEDDIHTADHDIQLIQHVLTKMATDTHLSLNDAITQAHDEISH